MSTLLDRYFVVLTHNGDTREVTPEDDDIVLSDEPVDGQIYFSRGTKNDIEVFGEDYDWLYAIHISELRCMPVTIQIKKTVPGGVPYTEYTGDFYTSDCSFNEDRCRIRFKTKTQDKYEHLHSKWERPINILSGTPKGNIYTTFRTTDDPDTSDPFTEMETDQTIETVDIIFGGADFDDPDFKNPFYGWVKKSESIVFLAGGGGSPDKLRKTVNWIREVTVGVHDYVDLPGNGWSFYSGVGSGGPERWTRYMNSMLKSEVITTSPVPGIFQEERRYSHLASDMERFTNGVALENVLNKLLTGTDLTVKSEFFEINETGDYPPLNAIYSTGRRPNIYVFQRSDILHPTFTDPATSAIVSLKAFLELLAKKFEVYPVIVGDVLEIEHISFRKGIHGIDFTTTQYRDNLEGLKAYTYDKDALPSGEKYVDNDGLTIIQPWFKPFEFSYDFGVNESVPQNCITRSGPVKEVIADVLTDIQTMVARPDDFNAEGLAFISAFPAFGGRRFIDSSGIANYLMAPATLAYLYRDDKYYKYARNESADSYMVMNTVKKYKIQSEIEVQLLDYSQFNPMEEQKTQFGWADIRSAEYSLKTGTLRFTPKHSE